MVSHAGELFKREILRQVQKGYAVNVPAVNRFQNFLFKFL